MPNFKKTWDMQNGCDAIITKENSSLDLLEVDMLKLSDGQRKDYDETGKEYALILLGGRCSVTGSGFNYKDIGKRNNVFDGPATALYIPCNRKFTVTAEGDVTLAVCKSPGNMDTEPVLVEPGDVTIKNLGKDGWQRQAHFIIDERINAKHLYIGEAFVPSAMTSMMKTTCLWKVFRKKSITMNLTRKLVLAFKKYIPKKAMWMKPIR